MKFQKFKEFFPDAQKNIFPNSYQVKLEDGDAYLDEGDLTDREKVLLSLLTNNQLIKVNLSNWQRYLYDQGPQPKLEKHVRFLYLEVKDLKKENRKQWQDQILSFFNNQVACFWQNDENLVIVDQDCSLTQKDFAGILTTMDTDFSTKTHLLMGLVWPENADLVALFKEEEKINDSISWQNKVMTIMQAALNFYTQFNRNRSVIIKAYQEYFKDKDDIKELVTNLYQVGGNVTQAAKNMFMHRNTLEYRIDKIAQNYYLNLHQMDDLVFCYLIFV